nr:unnamed protein product [Digitaria exilis]
MIKNDFGLEKAPEADVLCRLRLVCRSWLSLTSDPTFARAHLFRHPLVVGIHDIDGGHEVQFVDMSGRIVKRIPFIERDWDGYTVSVKPSQIDYTRRTEKTCVLNPRTGAFTVSPPDMAAVHESRKNPFFSLYLLGRIP